MSLISLRRNLQSLKYSDFSGAYSSSAQSGSSESAVYSARRACHGISCRASLHPPIWRNRVPPHGGNSSGLRRRCPLPFHIITYKGKGISPYILSNESGKGGLVFPSGLAEVPSGSFRGWWNPPAGVLPTRQWEGRKARPSSPTSRPALPGWFLPVLFLRRLTRLMELIHSRN